MAFTRFHDDQARVEKQLQELTGPGRYMIDTPGNGPAPPFMEDPFIRLQKWGANLRSNTINLESDLLGIKQSVGKDCVNKSTASVKSSALKYPSMNPITQQSRATHPAWMVRDLEQDNFQYLFLDPQENTCIPFHNNLNTRLIERDNFKTVVSSLINNDNANYTSQ